MTASHFDLQGKSEEKWDPGWSNAVFSIAERDLRWKKVRTLMARDGIDLIVCMPHTGSHDRAAADARYLTQLGENSDESIVAFPIEGDVRAWHSRPGPEQSRRGSSSPRRAIIRSRPSVGSIARINTALAGPAHTRFMHQWMP